MSLLKLSVLTISGVALWLAPPFILSRKILPHTLIQGVTLIAAFACAFEGRRSALKLAKEMQFEARKEAIISGDEIDEMATTAYISEQQRKQEAEAILASGRTSEEEIASAREELQAQWREEFQLATTTPASEEIPSDLLLWREVEAATSEGKSQTFIIENILKMKGRKFEEGKIKLAELTLKFGSNF